MAEPLSRHEFSIEKHAHGQWDTKVLVMRNPLLRALVSYCSYKRSGVDHLAKTGKNNRFVLDAGSGKGAYSRWYLGRSSQSYLLAIDWSENALRSMELSYEDRILPVCADLRRMPFKSAVVDALFSVDTIGHIDRCEIALDEFLRVCKSNARLFLHSECCDYKQRWPDRALIKKLGLDLLARHDGHDFLKYAGELYALYSRRFRVQSFFNPAGYLGFLIGYPEKYKLAFAAACWRFWGPIVSVFSALKKAPGLGVALRFLNAATNRLEVFLGLKGGGSCFAKLTKP